MNKAIHVYSVCTVQSGIANRTPDCVQQAFDTSNTGGITVSDEMTVDCGSTVNTQVS